MEDLATGVVKREFTGSSLSASFIGGTHNMLVERVGEFSVYDLETGQERTILSYAVPYALDQTILLEPGGQTLLVGYDMAGKQIWHLVDIQRGSDQVLTNFELFAPYLRDVDHRQIIFEGFDPATNQRHAMLLEVATGNVRALPHLPGQRADRIVELKAISPDGRFFLDSRQETECVAPDVCLITAYELWLRPLSGDPPLLLLRSAQAPHAAFSPDGRWVAVSTLEAGAHLQLIAVDGDDMRDLGPGYGAVWLQP